MKKKGFTLVELLVVIAIIALLMGILMPALARVRQLAFRMTCGTNLSGIGKAMLIYANDYEDELPKAGGRKNTWVPSLPQFGSPLRNQAYGMASTSANGQVTASSSLYLLVKYAEVTPKSFICKGESDTREFTLAEWVGKGGVQQDDELIDVWDFGMYEDAEINQTKHCSYSYHAPFGSYALTVAHEPTMAVAADRSPWFDPAISNKAERFGNFTPDIEPFTNGTAETAKRGNSEAHQQEGQNVLFLDSHVAFEKRSSVGIENDNIYTYYTTAQKSANQIAKGTMPTAYVDLNPLIQNRRDSVLVQESGEAGGGSSSGGGRGR